MCKVKLASLAAVALGVLVPGPAQAQSGSILVDPAIPYGYDRGRNVSVLDRQRPDYDPLGIRAGGFMVFPRLDVGVGASSNVYLSETDEVGDFYGVLTPSVRVNSNWSRHQLMVHGGAALRRFAEETERKEDAWWLNALGRVDLGTSYAVTAEAQAGRTFESPFAGELESDIAVLSSYDRVMGGVRGQYQGSRTRTVLAVDFNAFDFNTVELADGTERSQADRDRTISRVTGQLEYALSPSISAYGQLSYAETDYERALFSGAPNRDSKAARVLAGVNFDLSAFMRGTVGIGYIDRNYSADIYDDVSGLSFEGRIEYFRTELTTYELAFRRVIEDSSIGAANAFFDNRGSLRVHHELLRNLIVNASGEYAIQDYIDSDRSNEVFRLGGGARYLMSRVTGLQLGVSYGGRERDGTGVDGSLDEVRGELTLVLQR